MSGIQTIGLIASVVLPLWNIPLIVRMIQRKTSNDISLLWAIGVWGCLLLMAPAGFTSSDIVWRVFNIVNLILFSGVMVTVVWYRVKDSIGRRRIKSEGTYSEEKSRFTIEP